MYARAHTHTRRNTRRYIHTHTHTHTRARADTHADADTHTHAHTHTDHMAVGEAFEAIYSNRAKPREKADRERREREMCNHIDTLMLKESEEH